MSGVSYQRSTLPQFWKWCKESDSEECGVDKELVQEIFDWCHPLYLDSLK